MMRKPRKPVVIEQQVEIDRSISTGQPTPVSESRMTKAALAVAGSIVLAMLLIKVLVALVISIAAALLVAVIVFDGWALRAVTTAVLAPAIYFGWTRIANRRSRRGRP